MGTGVVEGPGEVGGAGTGETNMISLETIELGLLKNRFVELSVTACKDDRMIIILDNICSRCKLKISDKVLNE